MRIYQQTRNDKVEELQITLQENFLPSDTWGMINTRTTPEQAAKDFQAAILSDAAVKEQAIYEQLSQQFPEKYGDAVAPEDGEILFSVFPTSAGSKVLFATNYAQRTAKKVFTAATMGAGMKIHTRKIRNHFEPERWRRESWFFVAYALITGSHKGFAPIGKYN